MDNRRGIRRVQRSSIAISFSAIVILVALAPLVNSDPADAATTTYSATETIPVPPQTSYAGSGGGDGWAVALSSTEVFNVFHHQPTLQVACHLQSNAQPCWAPETVTDASGNNFATSGQPGLWLNQATDDLYVYATRTSDGTGGVVCINTTQAATNTDPFCGFTALSAVGAAPVSSQGISFVSDPALIGNDWFAFSYVDGAGSSGTQNRLLCFNISTLAPCTSQPFTVPFASGTVADTSYPPPAVAAIGSEVIIPVTTESSTGSETDQLACFSESTMSSCSGSWPVTLTNGYDSEYGAPFPLLNSSGALAGLCLPTGADPCYDSTGASVATPSGMSAAIAATSGWNGPGVVIGPRVYVPDGNSNQVECFDASTNATCSDFPLQVENLSLLYTVNPDPQRPTCLWVNADNGINQIQNFDAYSGSGCGQGPIRVLASSFVVPNPECVPTSYTSLQVLSPPVSAYTGGNVTFEDSDGNTITDAGTKNLDGTGTASLTGLNLSTAIGLPEFLVTLSGASTTPTSVEVKLTWTGTDDPSCAPNGTAPSNPSETFGNWAGYVLLNPPNQPIAATVTIPQVTCNVPGRDSMWVGYDGGVPTSDTVEQEGVSAVCSRTSATPSFVAWYELYKCPSAPEVSQSGHCSANLNPFSFVAETDVWTGANIQPNDRVSLFVYRIAPSRFFGIPLGRDQIFFSIYVNSASGRQLAHWTKTVTEPIAFSPKYATSECILEKPNAELPQFAPMQFSDCSAISDATNSQDLEQITMGSTRGVLARPSAPDSLNGFNVTWESSF